MKNTKRLFRGKSTKSKDITKIVIVEHNFEDDFTEQDCELQQFLNVANNFKLAATFQNNIELPLIWEETCNQNIDDVLYVITIENRIVKYGMTETSLKDRHSSLLSGKEKYVGNGTNSTTNVKSFKFISNALSKNKKVSYYYSPLNMVQTPYFSAVDGKACTDYLAATRQEEKRLYELIISMTDNVQPILNTQVPGGKKAKNK